MDYKTYEPISDLKPLVKLYWTLEVPAEMSGQKQRILPDGCIDMVFILGDDIKRYTSDGSFVIQPRAMVLGQITEPFFVEPTGRFPLEHLGPYIAPNLVIALVAQHGGHKQQANG